MRALSGPAPVLYHSPRGQSPPGSLTDARPPVGRAARVAGVRMPVSVHPPVHQTGTPFRSV